MMLVQVYRESSHFMETSPSIGSLAQRERTRKAAIWSSIPTAAMSLVEQFSNMTFFTRAF
jgi:hypothetical protein